MSDTSALFGRFLPPHPAIDDDEHDPAGFAALLAKVERDRMFRCSAYKERCIRRRIAVRMRAVAVHSYDAYARVLDTDGAEYERLLDALTINVTKLFRNWDAWATLADRVLAPRVADPRRPVRVWSAGTASGEEAYSAAALLHEQITARGESAPGAVEVLGTDVDGVSLTAAHDGLYGPAAFAEAPTHLRERYFTAGAVARVRPELRAITHFARHDLLRDPAPAGVWDLIICRNVVIYFDRDAQEQLFERLHSALAPTGVLFLGKVETLLGRVRGLYIPVDHRQRIFRRA